MSDDDREKKEFLLTLDAFFAVVSAIGDYTLFSCHKITDYLEVEKQLSDKWTELESLTTLPLALKQANAVGVFARLLQAEHGDTLSRLPAWVAA